MRLVEVEIYPDFSRARKPTSGRATEKSGGSDNYGALRKEIDQLRSHTMLDVLRLRQIYFLWMYRFMLYSLVVGILPWCVGMLTIE